jgi:hypothetical protein
VLRRGGRVAGRVAVAHLAEEAITARLIDVYRGAIARFAGRPAPSPGEGSMAPAGTLER